MNKTLTIISMVILLTSLFLTGCDSISLNSFRQSNCPQINVSLNQVKGMLPLMEVREFDGWKIAPYDSNTMMGFNFGKIYCHLGNKQGQNPDYLYCGDQSSQTTMAFMQKTLMNEDGTIGKTIKQSFVNIYQPVELPQEVKELCELGGGTGMVYGDVDEFDCDKVEYEFKETICGEDPDKIAEKEWEQFKDTARDFWE